MLLFFCSIECGSVALGNDWICYGIRWNVFFFISSGSICKMFSFMSANNSFTFSCNITFMVEGKEKGVVITSSASPIPKTTRERCRSEVQKLTTITCFTFKYFSSFISKIFVFFPVVNQPDFMYL